MRGADVSPEPHLSAGQNSHTPGRVESRLNFPLYLFVYNMDIVQYCLVPMIKTLFL